MTRRALPVADDRDVQKIRRPDNNPVAGHLARIKYGSSPRLESWRTPR